MLSNYIFSAQEAKTRIEEQLKQKQEKMEQKRLEKEQAKAAKNQLNSFEKVIEYLANKKISYSTHYINWNIYLHLELRLFKLKYYLKKLKFIKRILSYNNTESNQISVVHINNDLNSYRKIYSSSPEDVFQMNPNYYFSHSLFLSYQLSNHIIYQKSSKIFSINRLFYE